MITPQDDNRLVELHNALRDSSPPKLSVVRYTLLSFQVDAAYKIYLALSDAHVHFDLTSDNGAFLGGWWRFDISVNT